MMKIVNGALDGYVDPIKLGASKGKTYALEDVADKCVTLNNVDTKQMSAAEAGIESVNQDRFEKSEFDPRHLISNLFGAYSEKLFTVDYSYEKPSLPIVNNIKYGIEKKGFDEESIAQIAAEVGKRVDQLYKNGHYTDDEYRKLNEEIEYGTKQWVDCLYEAETTIRLEKERAEAISKYGPAAFIEQRAQMSEDERILERIRTKQQIMAENPVDFDALFALVEKLRNPNNTVIET